MNSKRVNASNQSFHSTILRSPGLILIALITLSLFIIEIQNAGAVCNTNTFYSNGFWNNVLGTPNCLEGTGTSQIRWGGYDWDCYDYDDKSGYGFVGRGSSGSPISVAPNNNVVIGTFTHYNRPIPAGSSIDGATLNIRLYVTGGSPSPVTFAFPMIHDETSNNPDRGCPTGCDYYGTYPELSCSGCSGSSGCPDLVTFGSSISDKTVTVAGQEYTLQFVGFKKAGETTIRTYFLTQEGCENSAELWFKFVCVNRAIAITKTTSPASPIPLNCPVTWTYTVTIPTGGNVPLNSVTVDDNQFSSANDPTYVSGDTNGNGWLDLTESWIFRKTGTSTGDPYSNSATATGTYAGVSVTSTPATSSYTGCRPVITFTPPSPVAYTCDATATIAAAISGCTGLTGMTYQWYKGTTLLNDGADYTGTKTATLTINTPTAGDAGTYRLVVTFYTGCTAAGEVSLSVTNCGRIKVDKVTDPSSATDSFSFTPSWASDFTLTNSQTPYDSGLIRPGTYTISELVPTGWDLTSVNCASTLGTSSCSGTGNSRTITLAAGDTVTVTFTDTKRSRILVDKVTIPSSASDSFSFTPSWDDVFTLTNSQAPYDSELILPGTYTVVESIPGLWALTGIGFSSSLGTSTVLYGSGSSFIHSTFQPSDTGAQVVLAAGDTVTLTFTDNKCQTADAGPDTEVCEANPVVLTGTATGETSVSWSVITGTPSALVWPYGGSNYKAQYTPPTGQTTAVLRFTAAGACSPSATDDVTINVVAHPVATIEILSPTGLTVE